MKLMTSVLVAAAVACGAVGAARLLAQDAQAEKTIIANERAVNEAVVKGDVATFTQHVAADGWSLDGMMGRMAVAEFVKNFKAMTSDMKLSTWNLSDSEVQWVDANTAIHTYKWTGVGTYKGEPIPSPVWTSTVWTKKSGKWIAVFHQESASTPEPPKSASTPEPPKK